MPDALDWRDPRFWQKANALWSGAPPAAFPYANNPVGTERVNEQSLTMPSPSVSPLVGSIGAHPITAATQQRAQDYVNVLAGMDAGPIGSIRAYHGSPYAFEKFDPAFIGKGEGNQAFGYGLYFADREGVAGSYRDMDHPAIGNDPRNDVTAIRQNWQASGATGGMTPATASILMRDYPGLAPHANDPNIALNVSRFVNGHEPGGTVSSEGMFALRALDKQLPPAPRGYMYEADLHIDPEHMLDWDKPLDDQSPYVQQRLGTTSWYPYAQDQLERGSIDNPSGESLHRWLTQDFEPQESAQMLRDAGIPGIRYLDQTSRAAGGEGTSNYVVFDPDTIDIIRRYGIPAMIAGGATTSAYGLGSIIGNDSDANSRSQ